MFNIFNGEDDGDPWLARDKLYHVLFCLSLTFFFSLLSSLTPLPFLRRHSIKVGSIISLSAGAAKEAADHLGFFSSSSASAKDAVADLLGVLVAVFALLICNRRDRSGSVHGQTRRVLPI